MLSLNRFALPHCLLIATLFFVATTASQGQVVTEFTDQPTFTVAAGSLNGAENFNAFAADTSFQNTSVAISNGTVSGVTGFNRATTNIIDVAPYAFGGFYSIDGSPYLLGDLANGQAITFTFTTPVTAWGADFNGIANGGRPTEIDVFDAGNTLLGTLALSSNGSNALQFYGFTVTGGSATHVVITNASSSNDVFGLDNMQFGTPPMSTPEPGSVALLTTSAMTGAGFLIRRRRNARKAA